MSRTGLRHASIERDGRGIVKLVSQGPRREFTPRAASRSAPCGRSRRGSRLRRSQKGRSSDASTAAAMSRARRCTIGRSRASRIVQRAAERAERAGLDPKSVGGHSLRAGFATTAAKRGKSLDAIMRQTLHKSIEVARGYVPTRAVI